MTWTTISTITVGQDWQATPVIAPELGYVRLTFATAGVPVWIAQVEPNSTAIYDERRFTATSYARIFEFESPAFFGDRALALRVPNFAASFDIQIEVSDMPVYRASGGSQQIVSSTVNATTVAASKTSVSLLAANSNRESFSITNTSTAPLYIEMAATATTTAFTAVLFQNDTYEPPVPYTGVVSGIWATDTNGSALVREFV